MDGCTKEPDQEGDEEASADPDVKDRRVAKLGDVPTDPVVQHEHVENGEEGEGASGIDGHDREVQRGVGGEDDQHLSSILPLVSTILRAFWVPFWGPGNGEIGHSTDLEVSFWYRNIVIFDIKNC